MREKLTTELLSFTFNPKLPIEMDDIKLFRYVLTQFTVKRELYYMFYVLNDVTVLIVYTPVTKH